MLVICNSIIIVTTRPTDVLNEHWDDLKINPPELFHCNMGTILQSLLISFNYLVFIMVKVVVGRLKVGLLIIRDYLDASQAEVYQYSVHFVLNIYAPFYID